MSKAQGSIKNKVVASDLLEERANKDFFSNKNTLKPFIN